MLRRCGVVRSTRHGFSRRFDVLAVHVYFRETVIIVLAGETVYAGGKVVYGAADGNTAIVTRLRSDPIIRIYI